MQNTITIREIVKTDKIPLCQLMTQLGYPISDVEMTERINLYCCHALNKAWVAEHDKTVIGSIAVDVIELFHRQGRFARIVALIIDEHHRQRGIGKQLVNQAESYAKQIGCVGMEVTTGWHRAKLGAHDFYKNQNYSEMKLYLAKEFNDKLPNPAELEKEILRELEAPDER